MKEGKIDISKTWLTFDSPNGIHDFCGQVLISLQILPKSEADLNPVGEAQNEPNLNPKLEKPSDGRGMGDKILAATNFDVGKIQVPRMNMFRNLMIIGGIFGIVVIILIVIMIFK